MLPEFYNYPAEHWINGNPGPRPLAQLLAYGVAYERTPMHADPYREARTNPIYTASDALTRKKSDASAPGALTRSAAEDPR